MFFSSKKGLKRVFRKIKRLKRFHVKKKVKKVFGWQPITVNLSVKILKNLSKKLHFLQHSMLQASVSMIRTDNVASDLGSNKSFSPGASFWFSMWSSWRFSTFSKPSKTVIEFPPRYLPIKNHYTFRRWWKMPMFSLTTTNNARCMSCVCRWQNFGLI